MYRNKGIIVAVHPFTPVQVELPLKNRDGYLTGRNQENDSSRRNPSFEHDRGIDNKTNYAQSVVYLCNKSDQQENQIRKPCCHATLSQYLSRCSILAFFSGIFAVFYPHNLFLVACRSKSVLVVMESFDGSAVLRNAVMSPWIFSQVVKLCTTPQANSARLLSTVAKRAALSSER